MADAPTNDEPGRRGFLSRFFGSRRKDLLTEHVLREIRRGRDLADVMDDPFVRNRADDRQQRAILDDPRVTAAVSDGVLSDLRARLDTRAS
jgi:hypothetical protein